MSKSKPSAAAVVHMLIKVAVAHVHRPARAVEADVRGGSYQVADRRCAGPLEHVEKEGPIVTHPLLGGLTTALGQLATDRVAGRQALTELWDGLDSDDAAGRCIIAHFLADAQDDLRAEIAWDETSLAESAKVSDDDLRAIYPSLQVIRFMPSLHLNLADGYRRLGRFDEARQRLASSVAGDSPLPERDPDEVAYREMILIGQQRIGAAIQSQNVAPLSG